jgi:hypothetical protein
VIDFECTYSKKEWIDCRRGGFMQFKEWLNKYAKQYNVIVKPTSRKGVGVSVRTGTSFLFPKHIQQTKQRYNHYYSNFSFYSHEWFQSYSTGRTVMKPTKDKKWKFCTNCSINCWCVVVCDLNVDV